MSNPVFNKIDKNVSRGGYADFGGRSGSQPAFGRSEAAQSQISSDRLNDMYNAPSAGPVDTGRVTVDDVIMKGLLLFGLLIVSAGVTFFVVPPSLSLTLMLPAIIITLVLGIAIAMKKSISVPLIVAYSVLEGVLIGAVSMSYTLMFGDGLVITAVSASLAVFVAMFAGWKTGFVKVTSKTRRIFSLAIFGYLIFALANLVAAWVFGANSGWGFFGFGSTMSIIVSVVAVGLASYSLAMDFDSIDRAVAAGVPQKYSWLLAHGLIVTVVWLYLEILRLVAQFSNNN